MTNPGQVPFLASVDAHDNAVSLYAYSDGSFEKVGSLATGTLPAQIIAADLNGNGLTDLVVRNAGDGTLSVFYPVNPLTFDPLFSPAVTIPVGLGVSDVQAIDTTGSDRLDLVVTNKLTGQVGIVPNLGGRELRSTRALSCRDQALGDRPHWLARGHQPGGHGRRGCRAADAGRADHLVTINPGSNTLDILYGLGGGLFANPVTIYTQNPAQIIRMADLTGNGIEDLVLLGTSQG